MRFARLTALLGSALVASGFQATASRALGSVTGRVIQSPSSDSEQGIRKALIIFKRGQEPGIGTYSDVNGNYHLEANPGAYIVRVQRDGYVASSRTELQTVTVQGGQALVGVNLELIRTGAISGRIVDGDGDPLPRANVQLRSVRERRQSFLGAVTDDRGVYRIFQVPPGKYYLSVVFQPSFEQSRIQMVPTDVMSEGYSTTYFPGTLELNQARAIDIPAAADLAGLDLQMLRMRTFHIRGRISGMALGSSVPAIIMMLRQGSGFGPSQDAIVTNPNGEFDLGGVLPGKYDLYANAPDMANRETGPSARQVIEVEQSDVEGIELALLAPQAVNGLLVFPEGQKIPQGLFVTLNGRARFTIGSNGGMGAVGADGKFILTAVPAGDYDISLGGPGPQHDFYISAIHRGDQDILSQGLHLSEPSTEPIEITLKPKAGVVELLAHTHKGEPFPEARVILRTDQPGRVQNFCITDGRGKCTLRGIAPGQYHAFAVSKDVAIDPRDRSGTKDFEKQAKTVNVAEGDRQSLDLEVEIDDQ